jgi:hypothetical protein
MLADALIMPVAVCISDVPMYALNIPLDDILISLVDWSELRYTPLGE